MLVKAMELESRRIQVPCTKKVECLVQIVQSRLQLGEHDIGHSRGVEHSNPASQMRWKTERHETDMREMSSKYP